MAVARAGSTARGAARLALAATLLLAAVESRAGTVDSTAGAVTALPVTASAVGSAGADAFAASSFSASVPFQVRREANPRYRPPIAGAHAITPGKVSRLRALDRLGVEVFHAGTGNAASVTQWRFAAGEQYRSNDALEMVATGGSQRSDSRLHSLRLSGRWGGFAASAGDAEPFLLGRLAYLPRLRGGVVKLVAPDQSRWLLLGGVPTPIPGTPTPSIGLGGLMADGLRFDEGTLTFTVLGFSRGSVVYPRPAPGVADTLPGSGVAAVFGWNAPIGGGTIAGRLGTQVHDLDQERTLSAQHALEWSLSAPGWAMTLSDERNTEHARVLGTDQFTATPRRENRWNVQTRFPRGRTESHFFGVVREGGDPAMETRTVQIGASGAFGPGWYGGVDATWDRRKVAAFEERRFSLHSGGSLPRGHAMVGRLELAVRSGSDLLTTSVEASLALPRGMRLELEPRAGWSDDQLGYGQLGARVTWPTRWLGARMTGGVVVGASRDRAFQGAVTEASFALICSPRLRDRGNFEARRIDRDGRPVMEYSASYEAQHERYETMGGWSATRDTGRIMVRVVRSGTSAGASDVVVSLDGQQLRFTDADGVARFDQVQPGVHVIAIEEHSLPEHHQVVSASRVFVTVERGRVPEPVEFAIARQERRTRF